ncbi:MAG TPA: DUF4013 domain-containing protein [Thermoanaerobaculia bacterium]|nr:DUF4013 domain-containing protein [Thermoanaerobaculia bacterium]
MTSHPPVPPPPAPPPSSTSAASLDFGKAFTFPFQDPDWLSKTLIGGLFSLLGLLLVGHFFVVGYLARLARNVAAGMERPLPAWDDLGEYFVEGFKLVMVGLAYSLPLILLVFMVAIPAGILESQGADTASEMLGGVLLCLAFPILLVLMVIVPAAITRAAVLGRAGAAFELGTIFTYIKANAVNYVLAILVYIVANFASQFGLLLCCIGIFFTNFLSLVMTTWAFAETHRLSTVK